MIKVKFLALLAALPIMIGSCSKDNDDANSSGTVSSSNANKNVTVPQPEVGRTEVPHLASGSQYTVLVHSTAAHGVNMIIEWDGAKKAQRWTAYQMYDSNSKGTWTRKSWEEHYENKWAYLNYQKTKHYSSPSWDPFQPDPDLPPEVRTELEDYSGTGYNRGHICPSADRLCSMDANEQTFYLSNMQPQIYAFNGGVWGNMENQLRKWNENSFRDTLFVCKGGTIADGQTLSSPTELVKNSRMKLPVPKYFFMAILCKKNNTYKAIAFLAEHKYDDSTNLVPYTLSIDELEQFTGIDFFCNLPDKIENAVERVKSPTSWGMQ